MKRCFVSFLMILVWSGSLYNYCALADLNNKCFLDVSSNVQLLNSDDSNDLLIKIQSDRIEAKYPESILFFGNVDVKQGKNNLFADKMHLYQKTDKNNELVRMLVALDNVKYSSHDFILKGKKARINLNTKDTDIYQGYYQILNKQGHGSADIIKQRVNNRYIILEKGDFTTCLPSNNSWSIIGSEIIYDRHKKIVKIKNARFKIGKIPILYIPYLKIKINDNRRSGFLVPDFRFCNKNGISIGLPFYLIFSSNYDATITPIYMSKRGTQIQIEFRYLIDPDKGLIELNWLLNDKIYTNVYSDKKNRWMFHWKHNGFKNKVWRFNVDYRKSSDPDYLSDINLQNINFTDTYTMRKFSIDYTDEYWDNTLSHKRFKAFDIKNNIHQSATLLDVMYSKNNISVFDISIKSQAAKFTNFSNSYPETIRLHIEPIFSVPYTSQYNSINTEAKLMVTRYYQKKIDNHNNTKYLNCYLKKNVNRVIPQFKINNKMIFNYDVPFLKDYINTLEPKVQYLYIPYRNQKNIGIYDSAPLKIDYVGLFRDRTYSGLDRISSANQLTGGITTRIYDSTRIERFNASLGTIYYFFCPNNNEKCVSISNKHYILNHAIWVLDNDLFINNHWNIHDSIQYNNHYKKWIFRNIVLKYHRDDTHMIQLNYCYKNSDTGKRIYSDNILSKTVHINDYQGISQIGISGSWSLNNQWSMVGAFYYNCKEKQTIDQSIKIQYNTCCWAIKTGYERKVTEYNNDNKIRNYDKKITLNIELCGLS